MRNIATTRCSFVSNYIYEDSTFSDKKFANAKHGLNKLVD
jgi:hypothetical protein